MKRYRVIEEHNRGTFYSTEYYDDRDKKWSPTFLTIARTPDEAIKLLKEAL